VTEPDVMTQVYNPNDSVGENRSIPSIKSAWAKIMRYYLLNKIQKQKGSDHGPSSRLLSSPFPKMTDLKDHSRH
jgi:hypothetical protein